MSLGRVSSGDLLDTVTVLSPKPQEICEGVQAALSELHLVAIPYPSLKSEHLPSTACDASQHASTKYEHKRAQHAMLAREQPTSHTTCWTVLLK